jgi:hypothetical protein
MRPFRRLLAPRRTSRRPSLVGRPSLDVVGVSPDGGPVELSLANQGAVLLFLTSSCYDCQALWKGLASGSAGRAGPKVTVVTPSPETESARKVAALAPAGAAVIMSSSAWLAYGITGAPWCVVVAGGVVAADGPAPSTWSQLEEAAASGSTTPEGGPT